MHLVQTQIAFEAAHRLYDVATYSKECRDNIHGHSYKVTIVVGRDEFNDAGMVVDFKLLKTIVRREIEDKYDHACILKSTDPLCEPISKECSKVIVVDENPTAEWMAQTYFSIVDKLIKESDPELFTVEVRVQETENNIAICRR